MNFTGCTTVFMKQGTYFSGSLISQKNERIKIKALLENFQGIGNANDNRAGIVGQPLMASYRNEC